jgi:hypothetical protein
MTYVELTLISPYIQDSVNAVFVNFFDEIYNDKDSICRSDILKAERKRDLKVKPLITEEQYTIYQIFMGRKRIDELNRMKEWHNKLVGKNKPNL